MTESQEGRSLPVRPRILRNPDGNVVRISGIRSDTSLMLMDLSRTQDGDVYLHLRDGAQPLDEGKTFEVTGGPGGGGRNPMLARRLRELMEELATFYEEQQ